MKATRRWAVALASVGLLALVGAEPATQPAQTGIAHVPPAELAPLSTLVGKWHITASWSDGSPLDARAESEWTLDHRFIHEKTWVKLPGGGEYQRYETMYGAEPGGGVAVTSFVYDGQTRKEVMKMDGSALVSSWDSKEGDTTTHIEQRLEFVDNDTMHWQVWVGTGQSRTAIMDGNWKRTG